MERVILHWTAGTNTASALDKRHYHYIIQGDCSIVDGIFAPEDNESTATPYAAHTRNLNTGSIGVALAAMHGAKESPFNAGKYPITEKQVDALVNWVARLCDDYGIAVTPETVLTHGEVAGNLGVGQRGKWDVNWLPGMTQAGHPSATGDLLRVKIKTAMQPKPKPSLFSSLIKVIIGFLK